MGMIDDFALLEKHGFSLLPYALAKSESEAVNAANKIGYPVVLKVVSPEITHKTDVGGVIVGIKDQERLIAAYREIIDNTRGKKIDGILVQKNARKGLELIIGGKKDEQFGHMIVLGLGGIYVEVFRDITARICPITKDDIKEMILELKSHPIILGIRGKKAIHMESLERLLLNVCKFMRDEDITEIDLNPVVFDENGCDIVDVRFKKS
jgi:succinyl-CoA synthetase beta subunit